MIANIKNITLTITSIVLAVGLTACASLAQTDKDSVNPDDKLAQDLVLVTQRENGAELYGVIRSTGEEVISTNNRTLELDKTSDNTQILAIRKRGRDYVATEGETLIDFYDLNGKIIGGSNDIRMLRSNGAKSRRYEIMPNQAYIQLLQEAYGLSDTLPEGTTRSPLEIEQKVKQIEEAMAKVINPLTKEPYDALFDYETKLETPLAMTNICNAFSMFESKAANDKKMIVASDCRNDLQGYINPQLSWVVPAQFQRIDEILSPTIEPDFVDKVIIGHGIVAGEGYACTQLIWSDGSLSAARDFDYKTVDFDGKLFLARPCTTGYADNSKEPNGIVDGQGQWLLPPMAGRLIQTLPDKEGHISFLDLKSQKMGSMNMDGDIIFPAQFFAIDSSIAYDSHGLVAVQDSNTSDFYGFINRQGQWHIPPILPIRMGNSYEFDKQGRAYAGLSGIKGRRVINLQGEDMYPTLQGSFGQINHQEFATLKSLDDCEDDWLAIINQKGDILSPAIYRYVDFLPNQLAIVVINRGQLNEHGVDHGFYGVVDILKGNWVIPAIYDGLQAEEYYLIVEKNNQYGILNYQNQWLYPLQDNALQSLVNGGRFRLAEWY